MTRLEIEDKLVIQLHQTAHAIRSSSKPVIIIQRVNHLIMSCVTQQWEVKCSSCTKGSRYKIRRYPHTQEDIEMLVYGEVECSCSGSMTLRKYQEKKFKNVYGSLATFQPTVLNQRRRIRVFSRKEEDCSDKIIVDESVESRQQPTVAPNSCGL